MLSSSVCHFLLCQECPPSIWIQQLSIILSTCSSSTFVSLILNWTLNGQMTDSEGPTVIDKGSRTVL